jgi:C_GCAxxG_C_C family probable redox protein
LQEKLDVGSREIFKAGSALAGGVASRGETCGALIGAIMAISSLVGREKLEDVEQLRRSMEPSSRVYTLFKEKIGHTLCAEIHKIRYGKTYRLFIREEMEAFHNAGGHCRTGCPEICGIAARIAAGAILDMKKGS